MDDSGPSLFARLTVQMRTLGQRLEAEGQAWSISLTEARLNGPHGPGPRIRMSSPAMIQNAFDDVNLQLQAYNKRNAALARRGLNRPRSLDMSDLADDEDKAPISTETASSFVSRLVYMSRVTLHIHAQALPPLEDAVTAALHALHRLTRTGLQSIEESEQSWHGLYGVVCAEEDREGIARALEGVAELVVLVMQAAMAALGMHTVRQSILDEYFQRYPATSAAGGESDEERDTEDEDLMETAEPAVRSAGTRDGDNECENDKDAFGKDGSSDAESDEDVVMEHARELGIDGEKEQALITNYFSPLA